MCGYAAIFAFATIYENRTADARAFIADGHICIMTVAFGIIAVILAALEMPQPVLMLAIAGVAYHSGDSIGFGFWQDYRH